MIFGNGYFITQVIFQDEYIDRKGIHDHILKISTVSS